MLARQIRRSILVALVAATAACDDSSVAPLSDQAEVLPGGAPQPRIFIDRMADDESSADFTVTPRGGSFRMGKHRIVFPRNVVCDPATSSYGRDFWDADCQVLRRPIRIHAELRQQDGREWVDFTPELRFKPSRRERGWVWIYMRVGGVTHHDPSLNILWSPAIGVAGIDESLDDPTLRTFVRGGYAYRRIKHFSGYNVTSGRAGTEEASEIVREQL